MHAIAAGLRDDAEALRGDFGQTSAVYNPLAYAREPHEAYLRKYGGDRPREALLIGMNPGPFGMAQTGVPFGDVGMVRDWLGITGEVGKPRQEHPKRPVRGFACPRGEVSGQRFWGWAKDQFGQPEAFFQRFFVWNYCPLVFLEESGRNKTPDKLPAASRQALFEVCDRALERLTELMEPRYVIGVGAFAEGRIRAALDGRDVTVGRILHPSPASPLANRGWAPQAEADLRAMGIEMG
jgi:single-strand selective monofunctional uracil DNA glycosylase